MKQTLNIFWFRRDLRLDDNKGFYKALKGDHTVLPIFIFDNKILDKLPEDDARVTFIHDTLQKMRKLLHDESHSSMAIYYGKPIDIFKQLTEFYSIETVYTNHDYEPYAKTRDLEIETFLSKKTIKFKTFKDQVIFEKNEITKADGNPYMVYTPYMKAWKTTFKSNNLEIFDTKPYLKNLIKNKDLPNLSLSDIGFKKSKQKIADYIVTSTLVQEYEATRNFPAKDSTSRLGTHLRFGSVSIRKMIQKAIAEQNEIFWQELIWREFFMQILWHFPHTTTESFKPKYDRIEWRNNEEEFNCWCEGKTGYPLVDAGMRQLNQTGFMHNRIRMLVGSFLCKHLLIDWRWGEAYFAEKLLDFELSANNGNWQWVAGTGCDAAPYFRVFNPFTQQQKFDPDFKYIKKWNPNYKETREIVEHKFARERYLMVLKKALFN
jgi:deoxyribodipyrimidine photo-lyase